MHSYFLSDLLDNQVHDSSAIEQRITNLGWKLSQNLHVMLLSDHARNFFHGKAQLITQQLHHMMPESRWVIYHGQIVFLISSDSPQFLSSNEQILHYLEINHLSAAVSNQFGSILDIRKHYLQAVKADIYGQRFHPDEHMHHYGDYMFYHMGEIVSEQYELSDFYHPASWRSVIMTGGIRRIFSRRCVCILSTLMPRLPLPRNCLSTRIRSFTALPS